MKQTTGKQKALTAAIWLLFALYMAVMLRMLIFRGNYFTTREVTLQPFRTMRLFGWGFSGSRSALINIWGNIGVFIPMGMFFQLLFRKKAVWLSAVCVAGFSLGAEVLQYILGVGTTDIDDFILNALGGLLGIGLYRLLLRLFPKAHRGVCFATQLCLFGAAFLILTR